MNKIAIIIPAYNEELTIAKVITDFKKVLPAAEVYVCDNGSTDNTYNVSVQTGAITCKEPRIGKGNAVRRLFNSIDADYYLMVDADDTYDPITAKEMLDEIINNKHDMVVARRIHDKKEAYRAGHVYGNKAITKTINTLFESNYIDILSGYRIMTRQFVRSFPIISKGFDIETEITVHAAELNVSIIEIESPYRERPEGSISKLSTYRDGYKILKRIIMLSHDIKPLLVYLYLSFICFIISLTLGTPIILDFINTGLVLKIPTAILCSGLMTLSLILITAGIILNGIVRLHRENKYLHYLSAS